MSDDGWEVKVSYHSCPYHSNKKGLITRYICTHKENKCDNCSIMFCPIKS